MPIVTLLIDFGTKDTYVAQMKEVVLNIIPQCTFVDITHSIAAQDILAGAVALRAAMNCFLPRTVHVALVDPGVGRARRVIAAKITDQFFVLPDNGLTLVLRDQAQACHIGALKSDVRRVARCHASSPCGIAGCPTDPNVKFFSIG